MDKKKIDRKQKKLPLDTKVVENDVLYQRLFHTWFAFTEVNGEIYYAKVPEKFLK